MDTTVSGVADIAYDDDDSSQVGEAEAGAIAGVGIFEV